MTPIVWYNKELGPQRSARGFEQKTRYRRKETNENYELVMKDMISNFFPSKALQHQKRYLQRGLYKPCDTNIRDFICRIEEMVEYFNNLSPFGAGQRLPEDDILELVKFSLPKEWQKELTIQRFESETQGLTEIFEFCERLKTS